MSKKKSKYPKKIKVGPYTYTVQLYPDSTISDHGACVYAHQTIFINPNQHPDRAGDTLLHEVLHAIWDLSGFDVMPDLHEETVVRSFASWLSQVLKDNPELTKFVTDPSAYWIPEYEDDALEEASEGSSHEE